MCDRSPANVGSVAEDDRNLPIRLPHKGKKRRDAFAANGAAEFTNES